MKLRSIKILIGALLIRTLLLIANLIQRIRKAVVLYLIKVRSKLQIRSLRKAIREADKDRAMTYRKNMVVLNTSSGEFEPLQKKLLKNVAKSTKNKSNKAHTPGRLKMMKRKKKPVIDTEKVKQLENKSLYVTG